MTVTEYLMKPGRFSLELRDDTPYGITSQITPFDHIVITPTKLDDPANYSDANVLAASQYTGVVGPKPTPTSVIGEGLGIWLGTDDGRGDNLKVAVANTAGSLSTWITSLRPSSLAAGTVNNTGTSTHTYSYLYVSRREAIEHMCRAVGAEYRINPNGTLDAATPANLFTDYTAPKVVITRRPEGYEGDQRGIHASRVNAAIDAEGYTTEIVVVAKAGDGAQVATGTSTPGANVYKDLFNNNVVLRRFANAPDTPAANAAAYANSLLALYPSIRRSVTLSSDTYAMPIRCKPGDRVYVYDQAAGLVDTANQITWRGELITPVIVRVKGYTWPIERGAGVYLRKAGGTYVDLTEHMVWEDGRPTTWEVGTSISDPEQDARQLSPAFLGVNGQILDRVSLGQKVAFTPTWSGTLGNGILTGFYRILGEWAEVSWSLTWGTTTSHAAAIQTFTFPAAVPLSAVVDGSWLGGIRIIDNGVGNYGRSLFRAGGTVAAMSEAGAFVTNLVPHTWGNLDQLIGEFLVPI